MERPVLQPLGRLLRQIFVSASVAAFNKHKKAALFDKVVHLRLLKC